MNLNSTGGIKFAHILTILFLVGFLSWAIHASKQYAIYVQQLNQFSIHIQSIPYIPYLTGRDRATYEEYLWNTGKYCKICGDRCKFYIKHPRRYEFTGPEDYTHE